MTNQPYNFQQDLENFISGISDYNYPPDLIKENPEIYAALASEPSDKAKIYSSIFKEILKQHKMSLYLLTRASKLQIDKAFYKHNYVSYRPLEISLQPLNLWHLFLNFRLFHQLVLVDQKKKIVKMVGGIPLPPMRSDFLLNVHYSKTPDEVIQVGQGLTIHRLSSTELQSFKNLLEEMRQKIKKGNH